MLNLVIKLSKFMKIIQREIEKEIINHIIPNKVIVISGARRVGKTFLLKSIIEKINEPYVFLNGENITTIEMMARRSPENFKSLLQGSKMLIIDEAQKIPEIGIKLKLMVDEIEGIKIIATGSSVFDIQNKLGEPLTGRKFDFTLYPLSEKELLQINKLISLKETIRERLVYGNYPEIINMQTDGEKINYLNNLMSSYLLKDILILENIKNSDKILSLLKLISFQVGSEVSYNELANKLSLSKNTVEKYLDLLCKVYILYKVDAFSRNKRKEISKSKKYYFYDSGIRNSIISNYNQIDMRNDVGILWENYMMSERIKYRSYNNIYAGHYFWRTYDKKEIDLVEESGGKISAFEMKWREQKIKTPTMWRENYPSVEITQVNSDNYFEFIGIGNRK